MRTKTITAGLAAALLTLTACGADTEEAKPMDAPPYKVVQQDTSGNSRTVTVEVDSTDRLEDVFNAVANDLTEEAGYHILINCSSGGTAKADNRLANGRKAVGNMGQAATGLKDGETEFKANEGRTCPKN
jgi:ABC-type glycerol-3-phosphate transport system substrate-binding protein